MNHNREQDADLMAQIADGNQDAFHEIYSRYKDTVEVSVRLRVSHREDAEDIIQEFWKSVWQKAKNYDRERGAVSTFFRVLSTHAVADFYGTGGERIRRKAVTGEVEWWERLLEILRSQPGRFGPELEHLVLTLIFCDSSPPHQAIVFGFVKGLGWKPRKVKSELAQVILDVLEGKLEDEYVAASSLDSDSTRAHFEILRKKMAVLVTEVITDPKTRMICEKLLQSRVGETALNQYFTHEPNEISHWCDAVKRRVVKELLRRGYQV